MGRRKTISDDEVLRVARGIFRERGHTASTRDIADAAGISEAILYQRFGNKNHLFFAAMHPIGPDIEKLLGRGDPPDDARRYLRTIIVRMGRHFADVIPVAMQLMTHPEFGPHGLKAVHPPGPELLHETLAQRIESLQRRGRLKTPDATLTARMLISLAHDWALGSVLPRGGWMRISELREMVDGLWAGLRVD